MSVGAVNKSTGDRIPTAGMPAIDDALDLTSVNPVQNAIITAALAGKQNTLTFDDAPTDGSNNPVKSNGIYDALAGKQDIFERISYADWQLLSPQQQAAKPYYIYDYPSTQITAENVSYDHTQSGLSATTAQGGIDELASEKQDATDNNLTTTSKEVVGAINEVKSGLNDKANRVDTFSCYLGGSYDGQHYVFDMSLFSYPTNRYACLMVTNTQNLDGHIIPGIITITGFEFASQDVTYDSTNKTITVDIGSGGWCVPILLIPNNIS